VNTRDQSMPDFARSLGLSLVCLSPLFWFMELLQNQLYRWVEGEYAWSYPASPYTSFYFLSVFLWAGAIAIIGILDHYVFVPRGTTQWRRVPLLALACFAGEWLGGFVGDHVGLPMQHWTSSRLVYIRPSAYWFWCLDVLCYDWLRRWMSASARPRRLPVV
jgi:hypothetical protein